MPEAATQTAELEVLTKKDIESVFDLHHAKLIQHMENIVKQAICTQTSSGADSPTALPASPQRHGGKLGIPEAPALSRAMETADLFFEAEFGEPQKVEAPMTKQRSPAILPKELTEDTFPAEEVLPVPPDLKLRGSAASHEFDFRSTMDTFEPAVGEASSHKNIMFSLTPARARYLSYMKTSKSHLFEEKPSMTWGWIRALINVANTVFVGVRVEYARGVEDPNSTFDMALQIISLMFCLWFTCELLGKLLTENRRFFAKQRRAWNIFDTTLVTCMIFDEIMHRASDNLGGQLRVQWVSALRILHVLVDDFSSSMPFGIDFRSRLRTLQSCSIAVTCPLVIIFLMIYLAALALTQRAATICVGEFSDSDLCEYFGSLARSMLSLYAAVLGWFPWGRIDKELTTLGVFYTTFFTLFITLSRLVVLNYVLSVVMKTHQTVENSLEHDMVIQFKRQKEYTEKITSVFNSIDVDNSGTLSREELLCAFQKPEMIALLDSMKLPIYNVDNIFDLMDYDNNGYVEMKEFVFNAVRMGGEAKGLDVCQILHQVDSLKASIDKICGKLEIATPSMQLAPKDGTDWRSGGRQHESMRSLAAMSRKSAHLRRQLTEVHYRGRERIPLVEDRAVSLEELRLVRQTIDLLCQDEEWKEPQNHIILTPAQVNLYHFNYFFLSPETLPEGVVFKKMPETAVWENAEVEQFDEKGKRKAVGFIQEILGEDRVRVKVINGCFTSPSVCPIYVDGTEYEAWDLELGEHFSYKELACGAPLEPNWFCSHWWGECIYDFVACIEAHTLVHRISEWKTGYWVCAYANDQHNLGLEIGANVEGSSFFKALKKATGVLLILESRAEAFKRIWCDFEVYEAIQQSKELDVVAVPKRISDSSQAPKACIITHKPGPAETSHTKMRREINFPFRVLVAGMRTALQEGRASVQSDKDEILQSMAKVPSTDPRYRDELEKALGKANSTLHTYFAKAAWPLAVKRGMVNDFDQKMPGTLSLPSVLEKDESMRAFSLDLSHSDASDDDLADIAKVLPANLTTLELNFRSCIGVTDTGIIYLARKIGCKPFIQKLNLNFSSCTHVTDAAVNALAKHLPRDLDECHLSFGFCEKLSSLGLTALARDIPDSVQQFSCNFIGTSANCDVRSLQDLQRFTDEAVTPTASSASWKNLRPSRHSFAASKALAGLPFTFRTAEIKKTSSADAKMKKTSSASSDDDSLNKEASCRSLSAASSQKVTRFSLL